MKKDTWIDRSAMFGALLSISIPSFISGPFLIAIFALWLGWLPVGGWGTVSQMILPAICLAAPYSASPPQHSGQKSIAPMVIQPSLAVFGEVAFYPLGTAFFFAFYMLITRFISTEVHPVTMQMHTSIAGTLICIPGMALLDGTGIPSLDPVMPQGIEWVWLFGVGFWAAVSHICMTYALKFAPSATLAPLHYVEIVAAVALGFTKVINLVIDNHAQWFIVVPGAYNLVQGPSNYHNLLRMGVPADRLRIAGAWIPKLLVDGIEADCAARIARACPSSLGASRPRARPSFERPTPRITPRIRSPSRTASSRRRNITSAQPSAGTRPSASAWNGRERPVLLIAWSAQKPMWMKRSSARLTAPAIIASASPRASTSHASAIA
jgi:hypothetical protein